MYQNLDEFLVRLEVEGELLRIPWQVESTFEVAAITQQIAQTVNQAVWFEQVHGSSFPVVTNLFGSSKRMAWALGVDSLQNLQERVADLVEFSNYSNFGGLMGRAGEIMGILRSAGLMSFGAAAPRGRSNQWVQMAPDLDQLPWFRHWPQETHVSLTVGQIITIDPETQSRQIYTAQLFRLDAQTIGLELPQITSARPAAVVLGGDPTVMWAIHAPLPRQVNPYWLAGWLRRRPVSLVAARSQPIEVPADAEFIIEGQLIPTELPTAILADFDGLHHPVQAWATLKVSAIQHRHDAIVPVMVPGQPTNEMTWINRANERVFAPLLHLIIDEAEDIHLPSAGAFRNLAVVKVNDHRPGIAHKAMFGVWGLGKLAHNRALIAVGDGVDIHDPRAVLRAVLERVNWQQNIIRAPGMVHIHDANSEPAGYGMKIAIDATGPTLATSPEPPTPLDTTFIKHMLGNNWHIWDNRVLVAVVEPEQASTEIIELIWEQFPHHYVVLVDQDINLENAEDIAWYVLSHINWATGLVINPKNPNIAGLIVRLAQSEEHGSLRHPHNIVNHCKDQLETHIHGTTTR